MKKQTHKALHTLLSVLNRFEVPQVLMIRAAALDCSRGANAQSWEMLPFGAPMPASESTPFSATMNHQAMTRLGKAGQVLYLLDERFPDSARFCEGLRAMLRSISPDASPDETLQRTAELLRSFLEEQKNAQAEASPSLAEGSLKELAATSDYANGVIAIVQPETASILTFGKAQSTVSTNRLRARNLLSGDAVKGYLQDRIKSRLVVSHTGNATNASQCDWSWEIGGERFVCQMQRHALQSASRLVFLASDVWLPNDVEMLLRAAKEERGASIHGAQALVKAFGRIGERPRGSCAVADVLPQGLDSPDADDMLDAASQATKALKGVKGSSVLGLGMGKIALVVTVLGVIGYAAWQWWAASQAESASETILPAERFNTRADSLRREAILKQDSLRYHDESPKAADTLAPPNAAIEKTVIAFENVPRTVVPVLLKTQSPISASNLASRVNVEFSGQQTVSKYRIELDTVKRKLPPKTSRLNVIIEQPLSKAALRVKVTYQAEETTSATVEVGIVPKNTTLPNLNLLGGRRFYYGKQIVFSNKQMGLLYRTIDSALIGTMQTQSLGKRSVYSSISADITNASGSETWFGNLENLTSDMFLDYFLVYNNDDTSGVQRITFEKNVFHKIYLGGLQRGLFISSSVASIVFELVWQYPNSEKQVMTREVSKVLQTPPEVFTTEPKIVWSYKQRKDSARIQSRKYLPNDIEIHLIDGVFIDHEVRIDCESNGENVKFASLENLKVASKPTLRELILRPSMYESWASTIKIVDENGVTLTDLNSIKITPLSAEIQQGKYRCKILISNLPRKPRDEVWQLSGKIIVNTNVYILNPFNNISTRPGIDTEFSLPINISYK